MSIVNIDWVMLNKNYNAWFYGKFITTLEPSGSMNVELDGNVVPIDLYDPINGWWQSILELIYIIFIIKYSYNNLKRFYIAFISQRCRDIVTPKFKGGI